MADFCIECGMYVGQGCTCDTDFVTQLKKELETWKTTVITQHKVFEEQENQILQIKSTLDEIKKIDEELTRTAYGYWTIESLHKAIKKALAKHEDDK